MTRTILFAAIVLAVTCRGAGAQDGYSLGWLPGSVESAVSDTPAALGALNDIDPVNTGEISAGKAALYSLLLPGLGDYKTGRQTRAYVFFGVEAAIWTTFVVSRVQGQQREDSYEEYAVRFAGISRTGHSDDYYALLREHDNSVEYEAQIKLDGREALWPDFDPNGQDPDVGYNELEAYFVENRIADYEEWEWLSLENKIQYQEIRSSSKNAYQRSDFALAAAVANRVVSAIFTYTSVRRSSDAAATQARRYHIDFTPLRSDYDASVTLIRRF